MSEEHANPARVVRLVAVADLHYRCLGNVAQRLLLAQRVAWATCSWFAAT